MAVGGPQPAFFFEPSLPPPCLVQRPIEQCLDHRLPADIEAGRPLIEFSQYALR
jgi:hypothetical protein